MRPAQMVSTQRRLRALAETSRLRRRHWSYHRSREHTVFDEKEQDSRKVVLTP